MELRAMMFPRLLWQEEMREKELLPSLLLTSGLQRGSEPGPGEDGPLVA